MLFRRKKRKKRNPRDTKDGFYVINYHDCLGRESESIRLRSGERERERENEERGGGEEKFILAINYDVNIFYRSIIDAPLGLRFTLRAKLYIFVSSPLRSNAIVNILGLAIFMRSIGAYRRPFNAPKHANKDKADTKINMTERTESAFRSPNTK